MGRDDPQLLASQPASWLVCDLTQSWSDVGGGVGTYLRRKRAYILDKTPHRHLMILPGPRDEVIDEGRAVTVFIASPKVPGSPHYRLLLRNRAVRAALEQYRPDLIECQDAYNLPWAAIAHRKRHPGDRAGRGLFHRFPDGLCQAAVRQIRRARAGRRGVAALLPLLRDALFALRRGLRPEREWRRRQIDASRGRRCRGRSAGGRARRRSTRRGATWSCAVRSASRDDQPMLIYAGRLDGEKRAGYRGRSVPAASRGDGRDLGAARRRSAARAILRTGQVDAAGRAGVRQRPRRAGALAGVGRHLCLGDGRRDVRHIGDRGAGVGAAGGRGRRRGDGRPRDAGDRAGWDRSTMPRRWRATSSTCGAHRPRAMG